MTCFWSGILQSLNEDDYKLIGIPRIKKININQMKLLINKLKIIAIKSPFNIIWQNNDILPKEIEDLKKYIKDYDINKIQKGHDTSSFDPFLCLLTDLLKVKIEFHYCKNKIIFQSKDKIRRIIKFRGTKSHFQRG